MSLTELQLEVRPYGRVGRYLWGQLSATLPNLSRFFQVSAGHVLGDRLRCS